MQCDSIKPNRISQLPANIFIECSCYWLLMFSSAKVNKQHDWSTKCDRALPLSQCDSFGFYSQTYARDLNLISFYIRLFEVVWFNTNTLSYCVFCDCLEGFLTGVALTHILSMCDATKRLLLEYIIIKLQHISLRGIKDWPLKSIKIRWHSPRNERALSSVRLCVLIACNQFQDAIFCNQKRCSR